MHSAFETDFVSKEGGVDLVAIAALVTEGRIPGKLSSKTKGFSEGPHCPLNKSTRGHTCDLNDHLCSSYGKIRHQILDLWKKNIPVCLEVLLACSCTIGDNSVATTTTLDIFDDPGILLEKWYLSINHRRGDPPFFNFVQLLNAIRSQLYFSQLTAWLTTNSSDIAITPSNLRYRLTIPGETFDEQFSTEFTLNATKHEFPATDLGDGYTINVAFWSLPRTTQIPEFRCNKCRPPKAEVHANEKGRKLFDDRMHTVCTMKGKHRCEDLEDVEQLKSGNKHVNVHNKRVCHNNTANRQTHKDLDRAKLLLEAIERVGQNCRSTNCVQNECCTSSGDNNGICDKSDSSDITSIKYCDSPMPAKTVLETLPREVSTLTHSKARKKLTFDEEDRSEIPSAFEQAQFRKDLDNAASMVFHSRTGLPLTSSPAPVRRGKSCFDFDSSINSVSAIKSALFPTSSYDENESDGSIVSPCSPETCNTVSSHERTPIKYRRKGHAANLLGSFEESVLNGRLEPVSTVHGFTAELGASGSFVPKHLTVPVTVFFYTLGDNDKVSSPYLGHINLGRKGYNVPKCGTVQVTLFNPLGTVVKMFVIMYDLSDMPPNSQTFVRQRTLYMPTNCKDADVEWGPKWLRYLIHLRFMSSKSGKVYLHSDIRMIIFRKSDLDTATAHGIDMSSYELRSFTHMPVNPRFSPRNK